MKKSAPINEKICPTCSGTGSASAKQISPTRRIYPQRCKTCGGKGRVPIKATSKN